MLFLEKIMLNKKIKSKIDIETEISLKTIAEIPLKEKNTKTISSENEEILITKAFKNLRTNIQFLCVNNTADKEVMLVTSSREDEGKSFVAANLAVSFAEIGKKVLIIDGDMINGKQDKIFNIPNNLGLSNYLSNIDSNGAEINEFLSKYLNETTAKNVNLITSGTVPPNPAELLASPRLQELIKDAKVFFDIIIIDAGEVLEKTEALVLARNVNSTILVASNKETSIEDLNNTKKDIQNVGGKIIGVVLNRVKIQKPRKTKAQRIDDFNRFKLKVKEKINTAIENIKRKIQEANQKLLEEGKKEAEQEDKKEEVVVPQETKKEEVITVSEKKEETNVEEKIKEENKIKDFIASQIKKIKEIKVVDKKDVVEEKEEPEDSQLSMFQENPSENGEENKEDTSEDKKEFKEKIEEFKTKFKEFTKIAKEKLAKAKEVCSEKANIVKEKSIEIFEKVKEKTNSKKDSEKNLEKEDEVENVTIEEIIEEKVEENGQIEISKVLVEEDNKENIENDKLVLVVIDAAKGFCRVFSKEYFTEKMIRGIDKSDNQFRAQYSSKELKLKLEYFIDQYQLTIAQAQRIDPLIYSTLADYDRYLWEARNITSNKAGSYALSMAKDFELQSDETEIEHTIRSQRLRIKELENSDLEVLYKLDDIWKSNKIKIIDKINLNKFSKIYEVEDSMKNDTEIKRIEKSKKFYTDVIEGAEKRLEHANEVERLKEEKEKLAIEEDRKIKQEELKLEQQQFEIEKKEAQERIRIEQENVKAEKKAEVERQKEERRKEKEIERIERKEESLRRKKEKQKQKEEIKFQKERERIKQIEEAKIEEDILEDNLYPKTKHNKNL